MLTPSLLRVRDRLDALLVSTDTKGRREADPVGLVHRYDSPDDREIAGLIAATLAFGNVVAIRAKVARVLERIGPSPARTIERLDEGELRARLDGFVHRVWTGDDVARMLAAAGRVRHAETTLGRSLARHLDETGGDLREALARLADALRGPAPSRGLAHLVPDPRAGSACKRLLLYLRWMTRPADGVDLGLWPIAPACLVIPVDTHVLRISRNLRLTRRRDASWRTAVDITSKLRLFDAADPVKYDFAICHLGVSRQCPSRRDEDLCATCVLRAACRHWNGARETLPRRLAR